MNKTPFLSIIIPSYTETERDVFPLLASIAGQCAVNMDDLEIILVRDGTPALDDSLFSAFPELGGRQLVLTENGGTGLARQAGIDAAQGTYIMCCDADDAMQNCMALSQMIDAAMGERPDVLLTDWIEEIRNADGSTRFLTHSDDTSWMHGKLLRREFLNRWNIRFHPEQRWNEETYFLQICNSRAEKIWRIPVTSYIWKWGENSITRRNNSEYSFTSFPSFIKSSSLAFREIERFHPDHLLYKVTQNIMYLYFALHESEWQKPEHAKHLQDAEDAIKEWCPPTLRYFTNAEPGYRAQVYNEQRASMEFRGVESETLSAWCERLGLVEKGEI